MRLGCGGLLSGLRRGRRRVLSCRRWRGAATGATRTRREWLLVVKKAGGLIALGVGQGEARHLGVAPHQHACNLVTSALHNLRCGRGNGGV